MKFAAVTLAQEYGVTLCLVMTMENIGVVDYSMDGLKMLGLGELDRTVCPRPG